MEMGNILRDGESRQDISGGAVAHVGRDSSDKLDSFGINGIDNRATADSVDGDPVNEVGMLTSSADVSRKEAESVSRKSRIPEPPNLGSNVKRGSSWEEWYKLLWKAKVSRRKENHRRIGIGV